MVSMFEFHDLYDYSKPITYTENPDFMIKFYLKYYCGLNV